MRDICAAAGANLAAIKYWFGGKEQLYHAVWEVALTGMSSKDDMPVLQPGEAPGPHLVRFFDWFLRLLLLKESDEPWMGQLLAQETMRPTPGTLETFVQHCCQPVRDELRNVVDAAAPADLTDAERSDLVNSLVGMCVNLYHSREIYALLGRAPPKSAEDIRATARTLAAFAAAGLRHYEA